jgi:hypothetical protein
MSHPEPQARVEEVRYALNRLLELLAREVVRDLFGETTQDACSATSAATAELNSGSNLSSDSARSDL